MNVNEERKNIHGHIFCSCYYKEMGYCIHLGPSLSEYEDCFDKNETFFSFHLERGMQWSGEHLLKSKSVKRKLEKIARKKP